MAFPVVLNGRTYTLADFEGTNYVDGLPDAFEDFVTHAGDIYNDTSTSSAAIGTGSKTFTVSSGKPYQAGTPLRIADAAAPSTNFLDAVVTSYSGTSLVVDVFGFAGSGTKTSWTINIGGAKTADGTLAVSQGGTGATTAAAARTALDTYSKSEADSRFLNVSGEASDVTMTGNVTIGDAGTDTLTINAATTATADISFGDNGKAVFGVGQDLQIYHAGDRSYISDQGSGALRILTNALEVMNVGETENLIYAAQDGYVRLYHDNAARLETTSSGIDITGTITFDGGTTSADLNFGDNDKAIFGAGSDLSIFHDGSGSVIRDSGTGNLAIQAEDFAVQSSDASATHIFVDASSGYTALNYGGSTKLNTSSTGIDVTGNVVSTGVTGTSIIKAVGADSNGFADVEIQSTGSTGSSRLYFSDTAAKSGIVLYDHNADNMQFHTSGTLRGFYNSTGLTVTANSGSTSHYFTYNENGGEIQLYDEAGEIATLIDQSNNATRLLELQNGSTFQLGLGSTNTTGIVEFRAAGFGLAGVIGSNSDWLFGKSGSGFGTAGVEINKAGVAGQVWITRSGGEPLALNRETNDGPILEFYQGSGTQVGVWRSRGGAVSTIILDPRSNGSGLTGSTNGLLPTNESGGISDDGVDLGSSTARFRDIYAGNSTIQTSDRNEKQDIEELTEAEQRVAVACKGLLRKFRWRSAVEEKGDDARIHFGIIAQDLQDAFAAEGLDAGRYGMFINSTWTDEETGEERSRMGVRYSELLAFIISAI